MCPFLKDDTGLQYPGIQKELACECVLTLTIGLYTRNALNAEDIKLYVLDSLRKQS